MNSRDRLRAAFVVGVLAVGVLAVGVLVVAGCSANNDAIKSTPTTTSSSSRSADPSPSPPVSPQESAASTPAPSPSELPATPAAGSATPAAPQAPITVPETRAAFGSTTTYSDAVQVRITPPQTFQPSRSALTGGDFPHYIRMTVTVVNGSGRALRLDEFHVGVTSAGHEGTMVVDDANGLTDPPSATVLEPGQQGQFAIAFGVENPADLTVEASPSFAAPAVIWSSR